MSAAETLTAPIVSLTERAVAKVRNLINEDANPDLKLRVFVTGGGCSGFQYGFTLDELAADDDTVVEVGDVTVLIDPLSYQYLQGVQVDYTEGLDGARFSVSNPNASTTCGCGSSFSV